MSLTVITSYSIHYTKLYEIIPVVTVEIPAVPEDLEITKPLTAVLSSMGVKYLNLHQIRCTQFNRPKLVRRGYTFIHGPGVAVLETELAALELIRHTLDRNIPLPRITSYNVCYTKLLRRAVRAGL